MTKPVSALEHYGVTAALCLILIVPFDLIQNVVAFLVSPLVVFGVMPMVIFMIILFLAFYSGSSATSADSYLLLSPRQVLEQTRCAPYDLN
jgi:hypothetical protein